MNKPSDATSPVSRHAVAILLIDVLVVAVCACGALNILGKPDLPLLLEGSASSLVVDTVAAGAGPAARVLAPGDTIVSVAGTPVGSVTELELVLDTRAIGDVVHVHVRGVRGSRDAQCPLVHYYSMWYVLSTAFVAFVYLLLGTVVSLRRPHDRTARIFHLMMAGIALAVMLTWGGIASPHPVIGYLLRAVYACAVAFVPALLLRFFLVFPADTTAANRRSLSFVMTAGFMLAVLQIATLQCALRAPTGWCATVHITAYRLSYVLLALSAVLSIRTCIRGFRAAREEAERRSIRLVLSGAAFSLGSFLLLWWFPRLLFGLKIMPESVAILVLVVAPLAFAAAVLRYRALDIDVFVKRGTVYMLVIGFLLAVYAVLIAVIALAVPLSFGMHPAQSKEFLVVIAAGSVLIALLIQPVRTRAQRFVDRRFFRVQYDYGAELTAFGERIRMCVDQVQLAHDVVDRADALIQVERIGFLLADEDSSRIRVLAHHGFHQQVLLHGLHLPATIAPPAGVQPLAVPALIETGVPVIPADPRVSSRRGIALIFPIMSEEMAPLGYLVLGPKKSGLRFSAEDVELLGAIAAQSGTALERIRLQRELVLSQEESERLAELNRMKSFFVSAVSHDLKTPLTSVRMFAELLEQRTDDETARGWLRVISGESERLASFIDNVLGYTRIEQGRRIYARHRVDLNDVALRASGIMHYQFEMHHAEVTMDLDADGCPLTGDEDALVQAVVNLLTNALKYSPAEKRISISTKRGGRECTITIADRGIGIAHEDLDRIFEPFGRATSVAPGTGLGLVIVRHVVDAHGGRISMVSTPGEGAAFTLAFTTEGV